MRFVFHALDRPDSAELRAANRPAHLAFHADRGNIVGGPLRDADGAVCGTLIVFDADSLEIARSDMADDPYMIAGLFESVSIHEFIPLVWPVDEPRQ